MDGWPPLRCGIDRVKDCGAQVTTCEWRPAASPHLSSGVLSRTRVHDPPLRVHDQARATGRTMKRWSEFAAERPDMAEAGRALIYQFRSALAIWPRCARTAGRAFIRSVQSSQRVTLRLHRQSFAEGPDLLRDGRFAAHDPQPDVDDEFYVAGRPSVWTTPRSVRSSTTPTPPPVRSRRRHAVRTPLERVLHAKYGPRPSWPPAYTRWSADPR